MLKFNSILSEDFELSQRKWTSVNGVILKTRKFESVHFSSSKCITQCKAILIFSPFSVVRLTQIFGIYKKKKKVKT